MPEVEKGWYKAMKDHPIWSKVIAGLILAGITSFVVWVLPGGWNTVKYWFSAAWHCLGSSVSIPIWLFVILWLCTLGALFLVGALIWEACKPSKPTTAALPNPMDYRTDEIFGVQWIWGYNGAMLDEFSLSAFCPIHGCSNRLEPKTNVNSRSLYGIPVSLVCGRCGFRRDFDDSVEQLKRNVFNEIERRIRTAEYVQRLKK